MCDAPSCSDGIENGAETDVDCGGGTCPACADGKAPTQACTDWVTFRGKLTGSYAKVTLEGNLDAVGRVCATAQAADFICQALAAGSPSATACDGNGWSVSKCGNDVELSADSDECGCDYTGYAVRPCSGNSQWGGIKSNTCAPPSQTITVICE